MEIAILVIALAIMGVLRDIGEINTCDMCEGSGKKKIKVKNGDSEVLEIETTELCHACKGTGRKTS